MRNNLPGRKLRLLLGMQPTCSKTEDVKHPLYSFLLRTKSFNELSYMLKENEFNKLFTKGLRCQKVKLS